VIFKELIKRVSDENVLWVSPTGQKTAGELRRNITICRKQLEGVNTARTAIELSDSMVALAWMISLDSVADTVFLVPDSLKKSNVYARLKERFQPTLTVDDEMLAKKHGVVGVDFLDTSDVVAQSRWVLATSGTTGTPKLIEHSTGSLTKTCKIDTARGKDFIWGLVYDPFRFAGLQVVLQALASGSRLVFCHQIADINDQAAFLREEKVNALSATPTYWRKILMTGVLKGHIFKQITIGGEAADQSVLNALRVAFPSARISHIYASTEAGVGFSVTDDLAGFPTQFLEKGVAGNQLRISASGTLLIKPDKYVPWADGAPLANTDGFIDTGDLVAIRGNRVIFLGRDSGSINVGGNKVVPEEVEAVIREVEGVGEVLVKPKSSGVMGQLVIAEIQPKSSDVDRATLKKEIMTYCRAHLEKYKVPALIRFVDELKHNPTGKISRT
jgi:acyl-coenzyme A synthetase/AMP-(fatty) acid ligase